MKLVITALRELVGLFLKDEFLAIGTLFVVGTATIVTKTWNSITAGGCLLFGCLSVLAIGVLNTSRNHHRNSHE
jgi:hypothetical protein